MGEDEDEEGEDEDGDDDDEDEVGPTKKKVKTSAAARTPGSGNVTQDGAAFWTSNLLADLHAELSSLRTDAVMTNKNKVGAGGDRRGGADTFLSAEWGAAGQKYAGAKEEEDIKEWSDIDAFLDREGTSKAGSNASRKTSRKTLTIWTPFWIAKRRGFWRRRALTLFSAILASQSPLER